MSYGSKTDSEGRIIGADSGYIAPNVGTPEKPYVEDVKISGIELEDNRAVFLFEQPNGAVVKHTEFESDQSWAQDNTTRRVKHICTKIVSVEEYDKAVLETESFSSFIDSVIDLLRGRTKNKKFRVKFVYNKKNFVCLPNFPNFIESMDVPEEKTSIRYNVNYDNLVPSIPDEESENTKNVEGTKKDAIDEDW